MNPVSEFRLSIPAIADINKAEVKSGLFIRTKTYVTKQRKCPSLIPTAPLMGNHTWQPVCIEEWTPSATRPRRFFTTIMT
jgi:hypothetical protein